uniref:Uncharacterized protein n=1 Tax=Vitis vinifera TaxID=29760 RepID=F6H9G0_VITVI
MDSLFFKENSIKISKIFSTGLTGWHLVHREETRTELAGECKSGSKSGYVQKFRLMRLA